MVVLVWDFFLEGGKDKICVTWMHFYFILQKIVS